MSTDPHRPIYHFSSGEWMNDPKPFFANGEYHVFFQYGPDPADWGKKYWGHAISRDLVHWEQLPIALAPTPGGPDQDGCWTGCAVADQGRFHILYTGIPRDKPLQQVQCLASSADLITWEKHSANPVIPEPPPGFGECFRDPQAWKEADAWYLVIGSEQPGGAGGAALLYRSPDLVHWEYLHPLFLGDAATGHDFECPDFFPLGDRHVLLSSRGKTFWHVGQYAEHRFTRERWGVVDGGALYAAKTLLDDQGRRLLWGWIREERSGEAQRAAGWSGVLSLPRVLTVRAEGSLGMEPAPELAALRGRKWEFSDLTPQPPSLGGKGGQAGGGREGLLFLDGVEGDALELQIRFAASDAATLGVMVPCSPDGAEGVEITYDREAARLNDAPLALAEGEGLELRIFVDRSVIEVFANGRACQTLRFYPERDDCRRVALFARGGRLMVSRAEVWEIRLDKNCGTEAVQNWTLQEEC